MSSEFVKEKDLKYSYLSQLDFQLYSTVIRPRMSTFNVLVLAGCQLVALLKYCQLFLKKAGSVLIILDTLRNIRKIICRLKITFYII